jgi:phosphohistidine phosphatase
MQNHLPCQIENLRLKIEINFVELTMNLYILRHGISEARSEAKYPNDLERPLSKRGKNKINEIGELMDDLDIKPDFILTSPARRCMESAKIIQKTIGIKKERLIASDKLLPELPISGIIDEISEKYRAKDVLLVGHEPMLSTLISQLTSGNPDATIQLKKGALCCLKFDELTQEKCAMLTLLLNPDFLV